MNLIKIKFKIFSPFSSAWKNKKWDFPLKCHKTENISKIFLFIMGLRVTGRCVFIKWQLRKRIARLRIGKMSSTLNCMKIKRARVIAGRKTFKIRKREFSRLCFRFFVILSFLHYHKWKFIGFRWDRAHDGVSLTTFMLAFISMFSIFMNYACTYIGNGSCCRCPFMWISPILPPPP